MKGQPETGADLSLGKKVIPREVITPDWKAVPGKQHHYVNSKGEKKYAPPVPDGPSHPTPFDLWAESIRKALEGAEF